MSSLNPVMTVGDQILEVLKTHNKDMSKADLDKAVDNMMEWWGFRLTARTNTLMNFPVV